MNTKSQTKLALRLLASIFISAISLRTANAAKPTSAFQVVQLDLSNLGPASFARNWGDASGDNQNQRQVITMHSTVPVKHSTTTAYISIEPNRSVEAPALPSNVLTEPTVPGHRAVLRHGIAYAPEEAPLCVKRAIWATNTLRNKPYVWGGGHDSFSAIGYDCSGTVSFALHYAGLLGTPLDSRGLMSFGEPGPGHWITVYARNGHTWMMIAGLRLDTTGFYGDEGPRFRADNRTPWGFTARHPAGL